MAAPARAADTAPTPAIIDETFKVYDECIYSADSRFYNCDCVAANFLSARQRNQTAGDITIFITLARKQCIDTAPFAGMIYTQCLKAITNLVPPKYLNDFCECSASKASKDSASNPTSDFRQRTRLLQTAYDYCGLARYQGF